MNAISGECSMDTLMTQCDQDARSWSVSTPVGDAAVPKSVLDAIACGVWNFEPQKIATGDFPPTEALPGSDLKLEVLSERLRLGLPLWHPHDRRHYSDLPEHEF
jgi:hypothetical protein